MAYYNQIPITVIGSTGILSRSILKALKANNISFNLVNLSRSKNIKNKQDLYFYMDQCFSGKNLGIIINTVASLNPKTKSDYYINQLLPVDLLSYSNKKSKFLIHLSTINVIKDELNDLYTVQKRNSEILLSNSSFKNFFIYRLPLIIPKQEIVDGNIPKQFKLINFLISLPFLGLIPPSRNIYKPLDSDQIAQTLIKDIFSKKDKKMSQIKNLKGSTKMDLYKLSKLILKLQSKERKLIWINSRMFFRILDYFLNKYIFLKKFFEKNVFLQQLIEIKRF